MEKEENKKNKKVLLVILPIIFIISSILILVFLFCNKNNSYEIEEVTNFSYFKLYENEKYGVIDAQGNILIEAKYDKIEIPNPSKDVFIGYMNYDSEKGEYQTEVLNSKNEKILTSYAQVLPLMFQDASSKVPYEKSVLAYKENGKYGIINFKGKKITNAIYDSIESLLYREGCLLVKQEEKYGIINIKGKQMVEIAYDSISADGYYDESTKYGQAGFIVGKKKEEGYRYGYINAKGEMLLDVEYNEIERITEIIDSQIYLLAFKNGQAGVYKNNKQIIKHSYEEIEYNKQNELFVVQKNGKQGVMNKQGNEIIKVEYDYIMITQERIDAEKEGITYCFDLTGKEQETQDKITTINIANEKYKITINEQDKYGIITKEKESILNNEYSYIEYVFADNFIVTKEGKVGIFDANQKKEIISNYSVIQKVENSENIIEAITTSPFTIELYNGKMEKVTSMKESNLTVKETYIVLESASERRYFDKKGNELKNTQLFSNLTLFAFKQEEKWGFQNKEGKVVVEPKYEMVTELNEYGFAGIKKDGKWGVINSKGEIIVEPIYQIDWDNPEFIGPYCKLNFGYGMTYYTKELVSEE